MDAEIAVQYCRESSATTVYANKGTSLTTLRAGNARSLERPFMLLRIVILNGRWMIKNLNLFPANLSAAGSLAILRSDKLPPPPALGVV